MSRDFALARPARALSAGGLGAAAVALLALALLLVDPGAARADTAQPAPLEQPIPERAPGAANPLEDPASTPERDVLDRRYIDAAEFRRAFENKTVHLSSGARHYGSEYYLPGDRSLWIGGDGPCRQGVWDFAPPLFCFRYGADGPYCWRVFEVDGVYYAESLDGLVLRIYAVEERPLQCEQDLVS